ncbi:hypothetical protein K466DRAFT_602239 [Polyporus arcularius HHB13444]|uniref:Uncharacterized protein n=1 Tax=Polyporus arcularius HHB13444 TaxID=1314778 RepID=A0A5C3P3V6_9APHY|nr:hypothetical protein K466DRAFT_602239 [Polyporus arcularius HHB13444]
MEVEPEPPLSSGNSGGHDVDDDVTLIEDPEVRTPARVIGCRDEVAILLDWAVERDRRRVRRYLESANVADAKWSVSQFHPDSCAWPEPAPYVMYGAQPATLCTVARLISGDFHMAVHEPPSFVVVLELLREVDCSAIRRLKRHWGGKDIEGRRIEAARKLPTHRQGFDNFYWAGDRMSPPGMEELMAFTSLRPDDLVYVEWRIARDNGDVVFRLQAVHFIARPPHNL